MKRWVLLVALALFAPVGQAGQAAAQSGNQPGDHVFAPFDGRGLTPAETRLLRAALTATGDYSGPLDGDWTTPSQRALETYSKREFADSALNAYVATLVIGFLGTGQWHMPPDGALAALVTETFDLVTAAAPDQSTPTATPAAARTTPPINPDEEISTGTGFYLGGHLLVTAAHVIAGCDTVALVDGTELTVLASDSDLDVAALRSPAAAPAWLRLSPATNHRLGQRVHALGYPYFGVSGTELNVTGGNVSALAGMDDDPRFISITAPVQPGNSGGPLLDRAGAVAGVVVARLSETYISETTGSFPQNVNFALSSAELSAFLDTNGLRPDPNALPAFAMDDGAPADLAAAVVPVVCY